MTVASAAFAGTELRTAGFYPIRGCPHYVSSKANERDPSFREATLLRSQNWSTPYTKVDSNMQRALFPLGRVPQTFCPFRIMTSISRNPAKEFIRARPTFDAKSSDSALSAEFSALNFSCGRKFRFS